MSKAVELPENYVAFVLPDASQEPSAKDLEKLRLATIAYLQRKLQARYPPLQKLQLEFLNTEFGSHVQKPAARFNLYIRAQATAHFDPMRVPERNDVFEAYVSSFTEDYLDKVIRQLKLRSLDEAIEVRARRLEAGTPGGAVTAPRFYMGFVCIKDPTKSPSANEKEALVKAAHTQFTPLLKEEFENDFDKLVSLKIVKTEIGDAAGKPDPKFKLYIEFEAVARFHHNVPDGMRFFRAISDPKDFAAKVLAIGGCFEDIQEMVLRAVFVESPDLPKAPEEEEEDGEAGEGEGEEKQKERLTVKVELGFYVALVIDELTATPNPKQLAGFDQLMHTFFTDTLTAAFKDIFVELTLTPDAQFQAGIPLPRFNMLHQYDATIQFYHPPPEGDEVLKKILNCNIRDLYNKISDDHPRPYNMLSEVTLDKALEKQVTDKAYGGKLGLEKKRAEEKARKEAAAARKAAEEKKRQEAAAKAAAEKAAAEKAAARKAAEDKKRQEEDAARKAAEEKKRQEAAAKAAADKAAAEKAAAERALAEKKRKEEEAAARREAEERARKEKERKEAEAKKEPEPEPTIPIGTADVFVAFTILNCKSEPSQTAYDRLVVLTEGHYAKHLKKKYETFRKVEVAVSRSYFMQNKPNDQYQVYLEWDVKASFAESGGFVPDRYELCTFLVKETDLGGYMRKVSSLSGTPFTDLRGVFTEQVNSTIS